MKAYAPLAIAALTALSLPCHAAFEGSLQTGYETRHIYRGVDSALESSIQWTQVHLSYDAIYGGSWYGTGPNSDYKEIDLYGGYVFAYESWRIIPNFIWYHFPDNDAADSTDVMLRVERPYSLENGIQLVPQIIYSYNLDAEGHYFEAGIEARYTWDTNWSASIRPAIAASHDLRPDNGMDHAEAIIRLRYSFNETFGVSTFFGYSYALEAIESIEGDEAWGGATLSVSF